MLEMKTNNHQEKKQLTYHFNLIGVNSPFFYILMKQLKENEPFPVDFWNYKVNHITGYYIKSNKNEQNKKTIKKYAKPPRGL